MDKKELSRAKRMEERRRQVRKQMILISCGGIFLLAVIIVSISLLAMKSSAKKDKVKNLSSAEIEPESEIAVPQTEPLPTTSVNLLAMGDVLMNLPIVE